MMCHDHVMQQLSIVSESEQLEAKGQGDGVEMLQVQNNSS
jgi:hypothetical protein